MTSPPRESILMTLGGRTARANRLGPVGAGNGRGLLMAKSSLLIVTEKELRKSGFPTGCRPKFRVILELLRSVGAVSLCTDWRQTAVATALVIDTGVWARTPGRRGQIRQRLAKHSGRREGWKGDGGDDIDLQIFSRYPSCVQTRGMSNVASQSQK